MRTSSFGLALALLGSRSGAALAQATPAPTPAAETGPTSAPAGNRASPSNPDIVVTGSLIRRQDYVSESPIVTVSTTTLQQSGPAGSVDAALSQLPQFTPSTGTSTAFPNRLGQALLNLRGLGANRVLVLVDGRRVQPSASDGTVDVNLLPAGLVRNVETITGGASAIYGSDAITGVVNFKLLDSYSGLKLNGQVNLPELGGGRSYNLNGVVGTKFAGDRGSVMLSLDYTQRGEILAGKQQPFYSVYTTNGIVPLGIVNFGAAPPTQAAINTVFARYGVAAGAVSASSRIGANYDGSLFSPSPVTNYKGPINDSYRIINNALINDAGLLYDLQFPLKRYNAFAKASYEIADNTQIFATALYNRSIAKVNISTIGPGLANFNATVPVTNPFIPADLRTLLASRSTPNAPFALTYLFSNLPNVRYRTKAEEFQGVLGADGGFGDSGWTWNLYGTYGRTTTNQRINGFSLIATNQLLAAADGGASLCSGGLNLFGPPSGISQACGDFVARSGTIRTRIEQKVAEATVQGKLVDLPAGALTLAIGADYRHNDFRARPDQLFTIGDIIPQGTILPAQGKVGVKEAYVEALIPIIHDTPLIDQFNIDAAYRYSDYSTVGGVNTYKVDFDWRVVRGFRFRGGYARATRAPSLSDLYAPATVLNIVLGTPAANNSSGDPCDIRSSFRQGANGSKVRSLCLAQGVPAAIIDTFTYPNTNVFPTQIGNRNLDAETADTYTLGAVWRSNFASPAFKNFQASIDYYSIKVTDAVGTVPFGTALGNCFNADNVSNPAYDNGNVFCGVVGRNALGQIDGTSRVQGLNLASYRTEGVDFQVDWNLGLGHSLGSITLNFVGNWLRKFAVQTFQSAAVRDFAGASQGSITNSVLPKWKSVTTLTYAVGPATLGVRWRYIGHVKDVSRVTTVGSTIPGVDAVNYFDLNGTWRLNQARGIVLRGGVNNLFNHSIPQVGNVPGVTDQNTYDIIGRTYYLGVAVEF